MLRRWLDLDALTTGDRGWTYNLAIVRLVFLGGAALPFAWGVVRWTERILPGLPRDGWQPVSFYALLPLDLLTNVSLAHALALADVALIALGVLGVFTRWTLGLASLVSLYIMGLPQNQGEVDHYHHIVWFMALLTVGPSGRFLSVDAIRAAIRDADRGVIEPALPPGAALSTLRWIWALFGLLYLAPGLATLDRALTGGWASAENLRSILWRAWLDRALYSSSFSQPAWVAGLPAPLLTLAGIAVIGFEVGFIALVFVRPARPWLALAGLFQQGTGLVLGIAFRFLTPAYSGLFDWAAMGRGVTRRTVGGPLVVLYDGNCRLCRRMIALVRSLDLCDGIEPVAPDDPRRRRFPALTDDMLAHDLYAVSGEQTFGGYDAYVRIADRIPLLWPLALLMRVPLVARVGRRLYRRVADSRACAVARPARAAPGPAFSRRWVTTTGAALMIAQATVSGGQLVSSIAGDPAFSRWSRSAWPFDHYPRLTESPRDQVEVWEPRAVLPGGGEVRVSPQAFRRAFGHPARSAALARRVLKTANPEVQRARSLELLRLLWPHERPAIRTRVAEVRVFAVSYCLGAAVPTVVSERLLHRVGREELESPPGVAAPVAPRRSGSAATPPSR